MCLDDHRPHAPDLTTQHSALPEDWLMEPVELREVEEELASEWRPDFWLDQWRALVNRMEHGDELWSYLGRDCGSEGELGDWQDGYALVRHGTILDYIGRYPW